MTVAAMPTATSQHWAQSLGSGAPGIVMARAEAARAGRANWQDVHMWARAATGHPVTTYNAGLFQGAPAVGYALAATGQPGYAKPLAILNRYVRELTRRRVDAANARIASGELPALAEYDLISGLTGLGAYLLHVTEPQADPLFRDVLTYLVRLTEPITRDDGTWPGWWTPRGLDDLPEPDRWPGGHGNVGLAHGISGPLALLSTAVLRGHTPPGSEQAIRRILLWLDHHQRGTGRRSHWPEAVSVTEHCTGVAPSDTALRRPSWCYGTPGIARAQQLAGLALADSRRQDSAEAALAGCLVDPHQLALLTDASLCHGWSGVLRSAQHAAATAGEDSELAHLVPHLRTHLARHLRQHGHPDNPGLLTGRAGIDLVRGDRPPDTAFLGNMRSAVAPAPAWDGCLLLTT